MANESNIPDATLRHIIRAGISWAGRCSHPPISRELLLPIIKTSDGRDGTAKWDPQTHSPLFALPPEVRGMVFNYALREFEDDGAPYSFHSQLRRPGRFYPCKSLVALLCTCYRVYAEAWWIPIVTSTHHFHLSHIHSPWKNKITEWLPAMVERLAIYHRRHQTSRERISVESIYLYTTGWQLGEVAKALELPLCSPQKITIVIRKHDWFTHAHLLPQPFARQPSLRLRNAPYLLPASVKSLQFELEGWSSCKDEVYNLAVEIQQRRIFQRKDSVCLTSRDLPTTCDWEGSSWMTVYSRNVLEEVRPGVGEFSTVYIQFVPSVVTGAIKKAAVNIDLDATSWGKTIQWMYHRGETGRVTKFTFDAFKIPYDASKSEIFHKTGGSFRNRHFTLPGH